MHTKTKNHVNNDAQYQNGKTSLRNAQRRKKLKFIIGALEAPHENISTTHQRVADQLSDTVGKVPRWTWRYPHMLSRGSYILFRPLIGAAVDELYIKLSRKIPKPTDPRLGAIRIDFEDGTDKPKLRAFILKKLTPTERGRILLEHAKEVMLSEVSQGI